MAVFHYPFVLPHHWVTFRCSTASLVLNKFSSCIPVTQPRADTSQCCSLSCSARAQHWHREGWQQDSSAVTETLINQGLVRPGRCSLACTEKPLSAGEASLQGVGLGGSPEVPSNPNNSGILGNKHRFFLKPTWMRSGRELTPFPWEGSRAGGSSPFPQPG